MNLVPVQRRFFARLPLDSPRLRVRGIGVGDILPPCTIDRPRGTGDHLILCACDRIEIDPDGGVLEPGQVMIWPPDARQFYRNRSGLRHHWLHADGTLLRGLLRRTRLPLIRPCAAGAEAHSARLLTALAGELDEAEPDEAVAAALIEAWILGLARLEYRRQPALPQPYDAIRREMENEPARALRLAGLAARAGVSVQHFGRRFRALLGETPIAYQRRVRMERAAWLLRDVGRSIASVASEVGCADIYHFSKLFRRHHGCPPRVWRQRALARRDPP